MTTGQLVASLPKVLDVPVFVRGPYGNVYQITGVELDKLVEGRVIITVRDNYR